MSDLYKHLKLVSTTRDSQYGDARRKLRQRSPIGDMTRGFWRSTLRLFSTRTRNSAARILSRLQNSGENEDEFITKIRFAKLFAFQFRESSKANLP
jgi:hypothetical protein